MGFKAGGGRAGGGGGVETSVWEMRSGWQVEMLIEVRRNFRSGNEKKLWKVEAVEVVLPLLQPISLKSCVMLP